VEDQRVLTRMGLHREQLGKAHGLEQETDGARHRACSKARSVHTLDAAVGNCSRAPSVSSVRYRLTMGFGPESN
jgi:hypothetical protein